MTPDCRSQCSLKIILENLGFQLSVVTLGSECHRAILSENGIRWRLWLQEWMPLCRAEWNKNGCHCVILSENGIRWQLWLQEWMPLCHTEWKRNQVTIVTTRPSSSHEAWNWHFPFQEPPGTFTDICQCQQGRLGVTTFTFLKMKAHQTVLVKQILKTTLSGPNHIVYVLNEGEFVWFGKLQYGWGRFPKEL